MKVNFHNMISIFKDCLKIVIFQPVYKIGWRHEWIVEMSRRSSFNQFTLFAFTSWFEMVLCDVKCCCLEHSDWAQQLEIADICACSKPVQILERPIWIRYCQNVCSKEPIWAVSSSLLQAWLPARLKLWWILMNCSIIEIPSMRKCAAWSITLLFYLIESFHAHSLMVYTLKV